MNYVALGLDHLLLSATSNFQEYQVYSMGKNNYSQCGLDKEKMPLITVPNKISHTSCNLPSSIGAMEYTSFILSQSKAFSFGRK